MKFGKQLKEGLLTENPVLAGMLGLCSALAITTSVRNGLGMGLAVLGVLTASNIVLSATRNLVPDRLRTAVSLLVIACFASCADLLMQAFAPSLSESLGIYLPLTAVNCLLLSRAKEFAGRNGILASAADGICRGLGYAGVLLLVSAVRELLGAGTLNGIRILPQRFSAGAMVLPVGGFLVLGTLAAALRWGVAQFEKRKEHRK